MNGDVLDRYLSRGDGQGPLAEPEYAVDDFPCFGWVRGLRSTAISLLLKKRTGSILMLSYAWIEVAEFEPGDTIVLHAGKRLVKLHGRNLDRECRPNVRLFEGLARHRISWLAEAVDVRFMPTGNATIIETISW